MRKPTLSELVSKFTKKIKELEIYLPLKGGWVSGHYELHNDKGLCYAIVSINDQLQIRQFYERYSEQNSDICYSLIEGEATELAQYLTGFPIVNGDVWQGEISKSAMSTEHMIFLVLKTYIRKDNFLQSPPT